jgi:cytosine/adenosine deaminase-related metal-dependent hydrolase
VLLIHMLATTPVEMKMVAQAGSPISVSPGSELRIGYGLTKACDFMEAGILVAVSVDTVPLTGDANFFGILKMMRSAENAKAFNDFKLTAAARSRWPPWTAPARSNSTIRLVRSPPANEPT